MTRPLKNSVRFDVSLLTDNDLHLFNEGSHFRLYEKLGSHPLTIDGRSGTYFAVWAPDADRIGVRAQFLVKSKMRPRMKKLDD